MSRDDAFSTNLRIQFFVPFLFFLFQCNDSLSPVLISVEIILFQKSFQIREIIED